MNLNKEMLISKYKDMLQSSIRTEFEKNIFIKNAQGFSLSKFVGITKGEEIECIKSVVIN